MCGRYTIRRIDLMIRPFAQEPSLFEEIDKKRLTPRFNVAPSQSAPVIRANSMGAPAVSLMNWGFVPSWTRGKPKARPINARAETIASSGMFRQAMSRRRCLVPADGFYEWRGAKPPKQPMFIHFPDDRSFAFAGVWERWDGQADDGAADTYAIITTRANAELSGIHDRMPVILHPRDYARWLDRNQSAAQVNDLLRPYEDGELDTYPVSTLVNKPANEGAELVRRAPIPDLIRSRIEAHRAARDWVD